MSTMRPVLAGKLLAMFARYTHFCAARRTVAELQPHFASATSARLLVLAQSFAFQLLVILFRKCLLRADDEVDQQAKEIQKRHEQECTRLENEIFGAGDRIASHPDDDNRPEQKDIRQRNLGRELEPVGSRGREEIRR